jgi:hypothetical protein
MERVRVRGKCLKIKRLLTRLSSPSPLEQKEKNQITPLSPFPVKQRLSVLTAAVAP